MWISCNECNKHGLVQTLPHFPQQPCIFLLAQLPPTGMLLNDSQYSRKCQRKGLWNYLYDSRRVALTLSSLLCLLVLSWTCCRELCCSKARLLENHCVRTVWPPLNWVFLSPPQRWWLEAWSISVWKYVWITYIWSRGPVHPSKMVDWSCTLRAVLAFQTLYRCLRIYRQRHGWVTNSRGVGL